MKENLMKFEGTNVEVIYLNDKVLFNPYHVGDCLGLNDSSVRYNLKNMNENQVITIKNSDVGSTNIRKFNNRGESFLTESGVYKLIFKSRKPQAEKFADWVADEVLPSIRKTGKYEIEKKEPVLDVKTFHNEKVLITSDITRLIGCDPSTVSQAVRRGGVDCYKLEGVRLRDFKRENPQVSRAISCIFAFNYDAWYQIFTYLDVPKHAAKLIADYYRPQEKLPENLPVNDYEAFKLCELGEDVISLAKRKLNDKWCKEFMKLVSKMYVEIGLLDKVYDDLSVFSEHGCKLYYKISCLRARVARKING